MRNIVTVGMLAALAITGAVACEDSAPNKVESQQQASFQDRYLKNQPLPASDWSQYRQTLIDVQMAQVHGQLTTTFFFNQGIEQPVNSCPSIGFPMPSTAQLSNPSKTEWGNNGASGTVGQMEPNGVYTGESTATYVVCVLPNGDKYIDYWEGFVKAVGAPAHWEPGKGVVIDGKPTVEVHTK